MTKHNFETLKTRLILGLTILCLLFTCLFGLTACKNDKAISDPTYSNTQTTEDDGDIKNATFAIGSDKTDDDAFPITSATGWTKAADNSATSSTVNSGIVKTTADSWKKTVKTLYADADFANYIENEFGKSKDDIKTAIKADKGEDYTVTDDDVAEYVAENYYKNPAKRADNADDYVYMLNNFRDKTHHQFGTAQKLTSASTLTLEKGKNYKITVWVKTANIAGSGNGANIRLTNSFGGVSQAEVAIDGIKVTEWTEYTLYVKASNDYDCSATLVLGLGYGDGSSTAGANYNEGTVYFDDVTLTEVEDASSVPAVATGNTLVFGETDRKTLTASSGNVYVYDMNANLGTTALSTLTLTHKLTESNVEGSSGKYTHGTYTYDGSSGEVTLDKSSVTLSLTSADFKVNNEEYFYLSFYVKNALNKFGSTAFTVDVWDIPATGEKVKRAAVYTSSEVSEDWTRVDILVKNNFVADTTTTSTPVPKTFSVDIVIGPTVVSADVKNADYASGTISFKDFTYKTGKTDKEDYVTTEYTDGTDNPEYKIYNSLLAAKANATVALYAGNVADYTAKEETTNYAFTYAPGDIGTIQTQAADVNGYYGVTAKHEYVYNGNDAETKTNVRNGKGDSDGNIAGLINTKYLDDYKLAANLGIDIEAQIGDYGDEDIQAIMIYNKNAGHYGFIGTSKTVSASAYAKVSVTLKVNGDAKAYVYLVDVASNDNQVMEFENFTVNTDASGNKDAKIENKKLAFEGIGKTDDFVTLTFYVAAGATEKTFRVEVWNGGRDGEETSKSEGFVFVKDITVTTSSAFTEPTRYADAFSSSSSPLFGVNPATADVAAYVRELTSTEKAFNKEYPDQAISYSATYVWAKTDDVIYAVYNTLDPVESDPYANVDDEEETSGCAAETDPSTFWLSFSSILLGVVLVLAIIALLVKTMRRRRIANRNDAKTQYKVKSRIETHKENQKRNAKRAEEKAEEIAEEVPETVEEEPETEKPEQNLDDYVYGDVQDFGDAETNEDKPENSDDKTE